MSHCGKVLSVGIGEWVRTRNAELRSAGFEVVAAISLDGILQRCCAQRFDLAVVDHAYSVPETAQLVRCLQDVFRVPVVLIWRESRLESIPAEENVALQAPLEDLLTAIRRLVALPHTRITL